MLTCKLLQLKEVGVRPHLHYTPCTTTSLRARPIKAPFDRAKTTGPLRKSDFSAFLSDRASHSLRAIILLRSGVSFSARALPPLRP